MTDEQQQPEQQQAPAYPGFQMTAEGLARLHQRLGQAIHSAIEKDVLAAERAAQMQQVRAATRAFTAKHTGTGCAPEPAPEAATNGHADIPTDVLSGETVTVVPTQRASSRARGG